MTYSDINDFTQEETCIYKDEVYSVRDNGAVMRHAKENGRKRKIDGEWTFGNIDNKGFLRIGGEKVNRIVSSAFYGEPPTEQYVVFHKNYNSQDNRASNLNWVTKFEFKILQPNIQSQLRILTGKKIEEILSDISILQTIDTPNLNWMKGVTQTEANKCLEKYIDLKFSTPGEIEKLNWNSTENRQRVKTLNPNLHPSLTPNAVVNGNMIPSYFPCCPQEISENPLQAYFEKLQAGNMYYINSKYKILILESALYEDKIIMKCESGDGENAIKPWSISIITYENEMYVHSLYKTCFHKDSADKYFTVLQGKKWTGGDVFDDFC